MTTDMIPGNLATKLADNKIVKKNENEVVTSKFCENCGVQLHGSYCAQCGQPEESVIQFFGYVIMHILNDVLGFDSRAGRTLFPLVFRPGFLTTEYIRGRRVHYVPPLRLYIFISIIFFIMLGLFTDDSVKDLVKQQQSNTVIFKEVNDKITNLRVKMAEPDYILEAEDQLNLEKLLTSRINKAKDMQASIVELQEKVAEIKARESKPDYSPKPADQIQKSAFEMSITLMKESLKSLPQESLSQESKEGLLIDSSLSDKGINPENNTEPEETKTRVKISVEDDEDSELQEDDFNLDFGEVFTWLSVEQQLRLDEVSELLSKKAKNAFENDAGPLINQILNVLPQIMFVLLPIFALLLKVFYLFSKRFYMEHLTVALHSHAFLFVMLMSIALLSAFQESVLVNYETLSSLVDYIASGLLIWTPVYLYLMQKRVYRQGHFLTSIKFTLIGLSYFFLLGNATLIAFIWGLAKL